MSYESETRRIAAEMPSEQVEKRIAEWRRAVAEFNQQRKDALLTTDWPPVNTRADTLADMVISARTIYEAASDFLDSVELVDVLGLSYLTDREHDIYENGKYAGQEDGRNEMAETMTETYRDNLRAAFRAREQSIRFDGAVTYDELDWRRLGEDIEREVIDS